MVGRVIAEGTYGVVKEYGEKAVVKFVNMAKTSPEQFKREVTTLEMLRNEPLVVTILSHSNQTDSGVRWIMMERHGIDLLTFMQDPKNLDSLTNPVIIKINNQILRGLVLLNKKMIVHGDVKPENILIDNNCDIKLADLGSAKAGSHGKADPESRVSPPYTDYECLLGSAPDHKTDVYGAGVVLYMLIAKRYPYAYPSSSGPESRGFLIEEMVKHAPAFFEKPQLMYRLMALRRKDRPSAYQALRLPAPLFPPLSLS